MHMHKVVVAALLASVVAAPGPTEAATIQITLNLVASRDIDIPVAGPPYIEFKAQRSSWGTVTLSGGLVAYYVFSSEDRRHEAAGALVYPGTLITLVIRTIGPPSELLILRGSGRPLNEGGGTFGGVIVATGSLAFLNGASFTTVLTGGGNATLVTITY
jgi:hypothetical protein